MQAETGLKEDSSAKESLQHEAEVSWQAIKCIRMRYCSSRQVNTRSHSVHSSDVHPMSHMLCADADVLKLFMEYCSTFSLSGAELRLHHFPACGSSCADV